MGTEHVHYIGVYISFVHKCKLDQELKQTDFRLCCSRHYYSTLLLGGREQEIAALN